MTSAITKIGLLLYIRLPLKSVARCRCVSKLWASTLRLPNFTELYLTRSLAQPRLLFACNPIHISGEVCFFSSPQPQNSSPVSASYHMKLSFDGSITVNGLLRGLVYLNQRRRPLSWQRDAELVVCNPSTGQSFPLSKGNNVPRMSYLIGYDPVEKQVKVLRMSSSKQISKDHQVLTLGTIKTKPSWRMIKCCLPYEPFLSGICINGSLYYQVMVNGYWECKIVCFDVRHEKFLLINNPEDTGQARELALVNYKGKLGALLADKKYIVDGRSRCFELWVLEDAEKHEWSKHVSVLPCSWKNVAGDYDFKFVGVAGTNEIVLSTFAITIPFYVIYYNFESKAIRRVEIQGMDEYRDYEFHISLNHVEDVSLM